MVSLCNNKTVTKYPDRALKRMTLNMFKEIKEEKTKEQRKITKQKNFKKTLENYTNNMLKEK